MENAANELLAKTPTKAHFDLVAMLHSSIWYFLRWPFYLKVDIRSKPVLETLVGPDSRKEVKIDHDRSLSECSECNSCL